MKLDILAFSAHPDDVELTCSATIIKHIKAGKKVGVVDLTQGELGTRGSAAIRSVEAKNASEILGLSARENLKMKDGFFEPTEENKLKIIAAIRKYQPTIVLANSVKDRHPDHGKASSLVSDACFLAGLRKISTEYDGKPQAAWRPELVYHYIQDYYIKPDFIVDVSEFFEQKIQSIKAYQSQFFDPNSKEPETPISGESFMQAIVSRAREYGRLIKAEYGEGFTVEKPLKINNFWDTI